MGKRANLFNFFGVVHTFPQSRTNMTSLYCFFLNIDGVYSLLDDTGQIVHPFLHSEK